MKFENLSPLEPITYVGWRYSTEMLEMFNATNTAARKAFDLVHKKVSEEVGDNLFKGSQGWFDSINSGRSGYLWYPQHKKINASVGILNSGVFIGYIYEPKKFGMDPLTNPGALMALMIEVGTPFQKGFISMRSGKFCDELENEAFEGGWGFYNFQKHGGNRGNMNYPIAVYLPMLDIVRDARNDPKEEAAYRKSDFLTLLTAQKIIEVFKILLGCETLPKLLEKGQEMLTSS